MNINFNYEIALNSGTPIDATLQVYLAKASDGNLPIYFKSLNSDIQTAVNAFYQIQKNGTTSFDFETSYPDVNYTISTKLADDPVYEDIGVTYFFDGNLTKRPSAKNGFLQKNVHSPYYHFDPKNGKLQFLLPWKLVSSIVTDLSNSSKFTFAVDNGYTFSDFEISLPFLQEIIPGIIFIYLGIQGYYPLDEVVTLTVTVKECVHENVYGRCNMYFNITVLSTDLFDFKTEVEYELTAQNTTTSFNINLSGIDILDITVLNNNFGRVDVGRLEQWVTQAFDEWIANGSSSNVLFKENVDLSKVLLGFQTFDLNEFGIVIGGSPVSNSSIKNFERDLMSSI